MSKPKNGDLFAWHNEYYGWSIDQWDDDYDFTGDRIIFVMSKEDVIKITDAYDSSLQCVLANGDVFGHWSKEQGWTIERYNEDYTFDMEKLIFIMSKEAADKIIEAAL